MKRLAQIVGSLACLLLPLVEARAEVDPLASKAAEEFLKGLTLIDLPEGKALLSRNSWPQWVSFPVLLKYETLFEGMFETDVPAIRGYKRLIDAEIQSKAKTALRERYLVVAYPDQRTAVWKVLVFSSGPDVQREVRWAESDLGGHQIHEATVPLSLAHVLVCCSWEIEGLVSRLSAGGRIEPQKPG